MAELEIKPTAAARLRVTGVMLAAAAISAVVVWLLTGGGVGLLAPKVDLKTFMPDATGLAMDSPVRLNGIRVGTVNAVAISGYLDRQRAVRVGLRLETRYLSKIPADSITSIGSDTLIGNKFVDIAPGKGLVSVIANGELASEPASSAADKADLIYGLQNSLRKVDAMVAAVGSPDTRIGRFVMGQREYDLALRDISAFEKGMREAVSPDNSGIGAALFTMDLYNSIQKPLLEIDKTMEAIQKGEGAAGKLYASDEQYNAFVSQLQDLRKTIAQTRTDMAATRASLSDDAGYRNIRGMLASTDTMLAALNGGEGRMGDLLNNPQMYESLVGSLRKIEDLLKDVRGNPKKYLRVEGALKRRKPVQ